MSFKEVTSLRKSGELDSALSMAREDYAYNVDNYSASALFWTLKLVCERSVNNGDNGKAIEYFNEMIDVFHNMNDAEGIGERCLRSLEVKVSPAFNQITAALADAKSGNAENAYRYVMGLDCSAFPIKVKENISWIIFYYLRSVIEQVSIDDFNAVIEQYLAKGLPRPSMAHSQITNLAVKFAGLHTDYDLTQFIRNCGEGCFSDEDFSSDPEFAGGLSLVERVVRRCFYNKAVTLKHAVDVFSGIIEEWKVAELLSGPYASILYKDSVELKDRKKFFADADEYVSRIEGISVKNKAHSSILDSVLWELDKEHILWFRVFFEKWGLSECLMDEDWVESRKDNVKLPSTAEKAILRYGDSFSSGHEITDEYRKMLTIGMEKLPDSESIPRRLSRILFDDGKIDEAIEFTKNLIKTRAGKYYFWYDLAEFVNKKDEDELCTACCAKALLSANDERYIGKVHLVFGHILALKGMFPESLHEIEAYRKTCEENGWTVKNAYQNVRKMIPQDTVATDSNISLYRQFENAADAFVYSDLESHNMVMVEYKFEEKPDGKKRLVYYLYDSDNEFIKINPNAFGLDRKAKPMSCFEVKYLESEGKRKPILVRPIANVPILAYRQAVVDNVNKEKGVFHAIGSGFDITVPLGRIRFKVKPGDVIDVAFKAKIKSGHRIHVFIHAMKSEQPCSLIKEFSGMIKLNENERGQFGFVDGVYVPRRFLNDIIDGDAVKGCGIMSDGRFVVLRLDHMTVEQ